MACVSVRAATVAGGSRVTVTRPQHRGLAEEKKTSSVLYGFGLGLGGIGATWAREEVNGGNGKTVSAVLTTADS